MCESTNYQCFIYISSTISYLSIFIHSIIYIMRLSIWYIFIFTISQKTKKRTTIWRWRHVISETKRFAPLVINLKNYNLLLILSQVLFSFGWKLKTPNFHTSSTSSLILRCFAISFCFYKYYSTFYRWWQRSCTTLILMMIVDTIF